MSYEQYQIDLGKVTSIIVGNPMTVGEIARNTAFNEGYACSLLWKLRKDPNSLIIKTGEREEATYHIPCTSMRQRSTNIPTYRPDLNNPKVKYKIIQVVKTLRSGSKSDRRICQMLCITPDELTTLEKDNSYLAG